MTTRSLRTTLSAIAVLGAVFCLAACQAPAASPTPAAASTADASDEFPLTVEHAMGTTVIPAKPLRVVALDPSYVDAALLLGAQLVGYTEYRQNPDDPFAEYLGDVSDLTEDAVNVGTIAEPDLEKILALEPDLIISAKVRQEGLYPQLEKIAPTIFSESTGPTWKQNIVFLGEALGKKQQAEEAVAAYEARAAAVGKEILAAQPDLTYSLVRFAGEDTARLYSSGSFIGAIMSDMGIPRPEDGPDTTESIFVPISAEQILSVDAGLVMVSAFTSGGDDADASLAQKAQFESNPLWSRLNGDLIDVDDNVFLASVSVQGADGVIDALAEHFGVDPQKK